MRELQVETQAENLAIAVREVVSTISGSFSLVGTGIRG